MDGVRVFGPLNLAADMPVHASQMYARTVAALITEFVKDGAWAPPEDDDIYRSACVARGGSPRSLMPSKTSAVSCSKST